MTKIDEATELASDPQCQDDYIAKLCDGKVAQIKTMVETKNVVGLLRSGLALHVLKSLGTQVCRVQDFFLVTSCWLAGSLSPPNPQSTFCSPQHCPTHTTIVFQHGVRSSNHASRRALVSIMIDKG